MIGVSAVCAETDERALELARSIDLTLLRFRQSRGGRLPSVAEATEYAYAPDELEIVRQNRARFTVGSPGTVRERLTRLADEAGVSELIVTSMIHDHAARRRSYELLAEAFALPSGRTPAPSAATIKV